MIIAMTVASSPPGYGSEAPARVTIDLSGGPGGSVPVLGGLTDLTLAEDADLTLAIRKLGYSIVYEDAAVALTEAPDTVRGFIRQRYRWMYGTMQAAWKHRDVLFRPRYGALGFVALPNVIVFQVLFPLVSPIMDLLLIGSLGSAAFSHWQHPEEYSPDALWRVLFYYALFVTVDYLAAILAFALERKESWWLLIWLFWQRFFYRQLMYYVAIKSTLTSLRGVLAGRLGQDRPQGDRALGDWITDPGSGRVRCRLTDSIFQFRYEPERATEWVTR